MRRASAGRLVAPTIVGFTALALLGRAGEMIRPYLIARKENVSFSSQLAVWAVERIFDMGSFGLLLLSAIVFAPTTRALLHFFRVGNLGTLALGLPFLRVSGVSGQGVPELLEAMWKGLASSRQPAA